MEQILDLENRIIQFIEINDSFLDSEVNMNRAAIEGQQQVAKTKWEGGK